LRLPALALLALSLLFLSGSLGLRTKQECDTLLEFTSSNSKRMQCYYEAAITQAYICPPTSYAICTRATDICEEIWTRFNGGEDPQTGNDIRKKAELLSNRCYLEVARATRNPDTCMYIDKRDDYQTQLFGEQVTKDTCLQQAALLAQLEPDNYYQSNPNNICAIVFVLPLALFASLAFRK